MDSSVSGSARAASSYISSGKIITFEYFCHVLLIIFSEWLKLIVANAEQHRDCAGGEVPLLRGLGGELSNPEDLHKGARKGERDERERLGQCGHQHQREVFIQHKEGRRSTFFSTVSEASKRFSICLRLTLACSGMAR